jgi:glycosyltransferase involved in cell wall biosynthesis
MTKLSALLPTYNNEKTIRRILESIKWCDEIFVVDSFSKDKTIEICREYTDKIVQHEYKNSASQKNWAIPQCSNEWILQVDTDEVVTPELAEEIKKLLANSPENYDAFHILRINHMFGKAMKGTGLYPEYLIRLFKRDVARFQEREVHAHMIGPGKTGKLKNPILHYGFEDIGSNLIKFERYTRYETDELIKKGKKFSWVSLIFRPIAAFFLLFFYKRGYRDGFRGFFWSVYMSYYVFVKYARLWEKEWQDGKRK